MDHVLLETGFDGLRVESATVAIRNSVAADYSDSGFLAHASSNVTASRNSNRFVQLSTGVFRLRGNNTVDGNTTAETTGTITTFGPM